VVLLCCCCACIRLATHGVQDPDRVSNHVSQNDNDVLQNGNDVTDDVLLSQPFTQTFTQTELQLSSDDEPLSTKNYGSSSSSSTGRQQQNVAAAVKGMLIHNDLCYTHLAL
jgi:hypothetical protein